MNQQEKEIMYLFPKGLPGFENYRKFRFLHIPGAPLAKLIAADEEKIGFVVMRAETVLADYTRQVILDPETTQLLSGKITERQPADDFGFGGTTEIKEPVIEVWVILTLDHKDVQKTTANLRAPLLLNFQNNTGTQVILNDERLSIRQPLYAAAAVPDQGTGSAVVNSSLEKGAAG